MKILNRKRNISIGCAAVVLAIALLFSATLPLRRAATQKVYPVIGVDVSKYQGAIDWPVLAAQSIDFAFVKATEGSSHQDERFAQNWSGAQTAGLRVGAYHFFSFDSPAETQSENFIKTVIPFEGMLPPVVDIELYGEKKRRPPDRDAVRKELDVFRGTAEEFAVLFE